MRNRLVDPSGNKMQGKELVLMDENFLRMACEKPFYVRQNTKSALIKAVQDDAKFLCEIKVIIYHDNQYDMFSNFLKILYEL